MPNSITGNTPAPMHNNVQPQQITLSPIATIQLDNIRVMDGLYCLNDLHKASGGREKHRPTEYFRSETGQSILAELEREFKGCKIPTPYLQRIIGKGKEQGTYACEEIACSYAMWISASFHLKVIRAFLRLSTYTQRVNIQSKNINTLEHHVSGCGRDLSVHGKQTLPRMRNELALLLDEQQLKLELGE